jgi:hypothetical protein
MFSEPTMPPQRVAGRRAQNCGSSASWAHKPLGEATYEDIQHVDGTTEKNVLTGSFLVYEWQPEDTCLPGCYWFEFKVLKMIDVVWFLPGGYWTGDVVKHTDGFFYTGSTFTDSSVRFLMIRWQTSISCQPRLGQAICSSYR